MEELKNNLNELLATLRQLRAWQETLVDNIGDVMESIKEASYEENDELLIDRIEDLLTDLDQEYEVDPEDYCTDIEDLLERI